MQWATLNKLAAAANNSLASSMFKGDERAKYIVPIDRDPDYDRTDEKSIDIKSVFQFVATSHGYDMHGERSLGARDKRLNTFLENYDIITEWYEQAKTGIDALPRDREFAASLDTQINRRNKPTQSSIQFSLSKLIEAMEKRRDGSDRSGKFKSYTTDPAGAINLQLMIAHKVESIRAKLDIGIHPSEEEIVPLDFEL